MSRRRSWPVRAAAVVLLAVVAVSAQGQDPGADGQDPAVPIFRTEANYIRVDVYVTRDGSPVTDLGPDDFELFDEGVRQEITQFEFVRIRGNVPQEDRREPNTVAESREMLLNARARVFVLFLDIPHVSATASRQISQPLVDTLEDLIGPDDLVGVMTPQMSAADVTFARRTITLERLLERDWWGQRDRLVSSDPVEELYRFCYPSLGGSGVAEEMIERRREKMTMDALDDLVGFLRGAREERKAILAITEGWQLFRPNPGLAERGMAAQGRPPAFPPLGVDPRTGGITTGTPADPAADQAADCDRDLLALAQADTETQFYRMLEVSNRSNASFYPVDPRGLVAFDSDIGTGISIREDQARLRTKQLTLRTLADMTDGLAVVNTNDIRGNLQRVIEDLSAYYLLGYYATDVEMDGQFHELTVRVTRPGVDVRARRGYLAPGREEMRASEAGAATAVPLSPEALAETRARDAALGALARFEREMPMHLQLAAARFGGLGAFWLVGDLGRDAEWNDGAEIEVVLTDPEGDAVQSAQAHVAAGARAFEVMLVSDISLPPGEYGLRVRARGLAEGSLPTSEVVTIPLPEGDDGAGARFVRSGPVTGNQDRPTADLRFRRNERLRVEVPARQTDTPAATLHGRTGDLLAVPLETGVREADDGTWWATAELTLAPLAPGDYVIELTGIERSDGAGRTMLGFRVIP